MKLSIIALLGLAASTVSAQDYKVTKPFTLKVSYFGDRYDAGINSSYIRACHAGAATKALCLSANSDPSAASTFTLNYTDYTFVQGFASGPLVYFLQGSGLNVSLGMTFNYNPTSNVAVPTFQPSYGNPFVGFEGEVDEATDIANEMFVVSSSYDESTFVPNKRPNATDLYPIYKWHVCWTLIGGYYYHALAWVTSEMPTNPTCVPVSVSRNFLR